MIPGALRIDKRIKKDQARERVMTFQMLFGLVRGGTWTCRVRVRVRVRVRDALPVGARRYLDL